MEFLLIFVFPLGLYLLYLTFFADLRSSFEKANDQFGKEINSFDQLEGQKSIDFFQDLLRQGKAPKGFAYYQLGCAHLKQGNTHQALYSFQQAVRFDGSIAEAYKKSAELLLEQQAYEEALTEINRALFYLRYDADGHFLKGKCLLELKEVDKAKSSLSEAVRLGSEDANYLMHNHMIFKGWASTSMG